MTEPVRRLTRTGITQFREYLQQLREGSTAKAPRSLLTDPKTSEPFETSCAIDDQPFATRLEIARYLTERFDGIEGLEEDVGFWSWFSLFLFDQVCPPKPDGSRVPGRDYRHILEPGFRHGHRHLLGGPFLVYRQHGERAALLLSSKIHSENKFHHELASRQAFLSNSTIIEAANRLYLDRETQGPKRGAQARNRAGALHRFVDVVQQLDLNYDLYSTSAESLIQLLPEEFDEWREG